MNGDTITVDDSLRQLMANKLSDFDSDYMSEMILCGLRKGVSSKWALLMWIIISDTIPLEVWDAFLVAFKNELITKGITTETIYSFCEDYCIPHEGSIISSVIRRDGRLFESGITMISKEDAESLAAWIIFYIG